MNITYTPVLKKKYKNDSTGIINIRVTKNRKSKYYSSKISIPNRFWNINGNSINTKLRVHRDFNSDYRNEIIEKIESLIESLKLNTSTIETRSPMKTSFLNELKDHIEFLESRNKIGTSKKYKTTLYHIEGYLKKSSKSDLLYTELNPKFIENFESYLLSKGIIENTTKNYINCIKRLFVKCVKQNVFKTSIDPFSNFKNKRVPVNKEFLTKIEVEHIISSKVDKDTILWDVKHGFLFQIFSQGLRVSDLMTLRFSNVQDGMIEYCQFKTKKRNVIYLTPPVIFTLIKYLRGSEEEVRKILETKYICKFGDEELKLNLEELKNYRYKFIDKTRSILEGSMDILKSKKFNDWTKILNVVEEKVNNKLLILIHQYSKKHSNSFIFPMLNQKIFENVIFNENTTLTKQQYNHFQSRVTVYNKKLKELQKICNIDKTLTSHLPRHTFTNLMISNGGDIYEISKSLGHQSLKTTETYVGMIKDRVLSSNLDLGKTFSILLNK